MAQSANLKPSITRPFGIPWRVGDVVAGELMVEDKSRSTLDPASNNSSVEATAYKLSAGSWDSSAPDVTVSTTGTDGILDFAFEPEEDATYRLVFTLTGDYKAKTEVTVRVHDPVDRKSAGGDTTWDDPV